VKLHSASIKLLLSTPAPIQTPNTLYGHLYETTRFASFGSLDTCFINLKHKLNLFADDASLREWQNISQEPPQVSTSDRPLKASTCTLRLRLPLTQASAPMMHVEVHDFMICVRQHHAGLLKMPRPSTCKGHSTFTVETSSCPTHFSHRRLFEWPFCFVCKACLQAQCVTFFITRGTNSFATNPASTGAVAGV
jgi:hypothetical protein